MKIIVPIWIALFFFLACGETVPNDSENMKTSDSSSNINSFKSGFADVNGMKMYYEIHGEGFPLILIHGGGSSIETTFGRVIPILAKNHRVIAVDLQAHGRSSDRPQDLSFEQDADDVSALMKTLNIPKADIFGFSNGATTALHLAIRHPEQVNKIVAGSPLAKRNGIPDGFWEFMKNASLDNMPEELKSSFLKINPDSNALQVMHDRDAKRMVNFQDIPDEDLKSIQSPVLIIIGDKDVMKVDHGNFLKQIIPNSELHVVPGGHGDYIGEITTLTSTKEDTLFAIPIIEEFLE